MEYLHSMIRVTKLEENLSFFCEGLGLVETSRMENESGRFTLIFLAAAGDLPDANEKKSPLIELTYNWPDENDKSENLSTGRSFGHLAYKVDDIYSLCESLMNQGITINRPPRDGHMAFIKSPEGISIELLQKGSSLPIKEPWASMANIGSW